MEIFLLLPIFIKKDYFIIYIHNKKRERLTVLPSFQTQPGEKQISTLQFLQYKPSL